MINTGPMGKSAAAIAGAPIEGMAQANAPLAARTSGSMNRAPMRRPPMTPHGMVNRAVGGIKNMFGGGAKPRPPMGASGSGLGPSPFQQMGFQGTNATGATGPMSKFGAGGPPPMGGPVSGGPDMGAGPVADTAPPMYQPPPNMGGSDMGMGGGDPMLMDQYMPQQPQRDPRFRY